MLKKVLFLLLLPSLTLTAGFSVPVRFDRLKADLTSALKPLLTFHVELRKRQIAEKRLSAVVSGKYAGIFPEFESVFRAELEKFRRNSLQTAAASIAGWQQNKLTHTAIYRETSFRQSAAGSAMQRRLRAGKNIFAWMDSTAERPWADFENCHRQIRMTGQRNAALLAGSKINSQLNKWSAESIIHTEKIYRDSAAKGYRSALVDYSGYLIRNQRQIIERAAVETEKLSRKAADDVLCERRMAAAGKTVKWMRESNSGMENRTENGLRNAAADMLKQNKKNIFITVLGHRKAGLQLDYRKMLTFCTGDYSEPEGNGTSCNYARLEKIAGVTETIRTSNDLEKVMRGALFLQDENLSDEQLIQIRQMKSDGSDRQAIAAIRENLRVLSEFGGRMVWQMRMDFVEVADNHAKVNVFVPDPVKKECRIVYYLRKDGGRWLVYKTEQECKEI